MTPQTILWLPLTVGLSQREGLISSEDPKPFAMRSAIAPLLFLLLCQHVRAASEDDDDDDATSGGGELDDDVKRNALGIREADAQREVDQAASADGTRRNFHDKFIAAQQKLYGEEDQVPASLINHFKFDRSWEVAKGGFCT